MLHSIRLHMIWPQRLADFLLSNVIKNLIFEKKNALYFVSRPTRPTIVHIIFGTNPLPHFNVVFQNDIA